MLARVFEGQEQGFYIDVGAMDPVDGSVTKHFYDQGWRGINVEPVARFFEALEQQRQRDINLNLGVGGATSALTFYEFETQGISTCDRDFAEHFLEQGHPFTERQLDVMTLADICEQYAPETIDFLKIDVEGLEGDVIRGADWSRFRPRVLVIESTKPFSHDPLWDAWEPELLQSGYLFVYFDGINRFYIRGEEPELEVKFAFPPNVLDGFQTWDQVKALEQNRELTGQVQGLQAAQSELESLRGQVEAVSARAQGAEADLHALRSSRSYRFGLTARRFAEPVRPLLRPAARLARRTRRGVHDGRSRWHRTSRPVRSQTLLHLYREAISPGRLYSFPVTGGESPPGFESGNDALKELHEILVRDALSGDRTPGELASAIRATGHHDESALLERRLEPQQRAAIVQAEIARVLDDPPPAAAVRRTASSAGRLTVVDVRCLQDPWYRGRGVGRHARQVLETLAGLRDREGELILLADPSLPPLDPEVTALGTRSVASIPSVELDDVIRLIELSPMTASPGPVLSMLLAPWIHKIAVVYDFIPREFAGKYLLSPEQLIPYASQLKALSRYDSFLAISARTAASIEGIIGRPASVAVTGVADPLDGLEEDSSATLEQIRPFSRYFLTTSGADPRKNLLAAIAAIAAHRGFGLRGTGLVVVGAYAQERIEEAERFAIDCGLGPDCLAFYTGLSDHQLQDLYAGAELVIVPSFAEGFSIPVVEAVSSGAPVVASDIDVHRELLGEGWWLAPPEDPVALGSSITKAMRDRNGLLERQKAALGDRYRTATVAARISEAMDEAAAEYGTGDVSDLPVVSAGSRPRIAVLTPMPPQRSGVAEYSAVTLGALARYADIVIYTDRNAAADAGPGIELRDYAIEPFLERDFDAVVSVLGNSHFHIPILEYFFEFGGACIAHDPRMAEIYNFMRGPAELASMLSRHSHDPVRAEDIPNLFANLDQLPSIAYDEIAPRGRPLIVHADGIASRIHRETGISPVVLPFVPHRLPGIDSIPAEKVAAARRSLGWQDDELHVVTFGHVDHGYKATDVLLDALAWLRQWGCDCRIHFAGSANEPEQQHLLRRSHNLQLDPYMDITGWISDDLMDTYLFAADAAVQLRTYSQAPLSGAVLDCIAFGVPCVANASLVSEMQAPPYVNGIQDRFSGLLLAESLDEVLAGRRMERSAEIDRQRSEWLAERTTDIYVCRLLAELDLGERLP